MGPVERETRGRMIRKTLDRAVAEFAGAPFTTRTLMRMLPGASRVAVDKHLSRLVAERALTRIARGLYAQPRHHETLGEIPIAPEALANAISRDESSAPIPSGSAALHALGLSEQVPNRAVFLTTGANRKIEIGGRTLEMRHVAPSRMRIVNPKIATMIEALRELGKTRLSENIVEKLRATLSPQERSLLVDLIPDAPTWMQSVLRHISALQ